jgi:hypothetical protein
MVCTECFLKSLQSPLIHLLCLSQLALITVENAQVVDCEEYGCMVYTECLLTSLESLQIHLLYFSQLALIMVEIAQVMDCIKCRCMVCTKCLFLAEPADASSLPQPAYPAYGRDCPSC